MGFGKSTLIWACGRPKKRCSQTQRIRVPKYDSQWIIHNYRKIKILLRWVLHVVVGQYRAAFDKVDEGLNNIRIKLSPGTVMNRLQGVAGIHLFAVCSV